MNKEKKIIPELRFPEFKNAKPWAETPLNELAGKVVLRNTGSLITKVFTNSAIDGIVDQREYFDRDIADKNNLDNYYLVEPDDYVYNPRISVVAPVGPVSKNKLNEIGAMSPLYTVFRFKEKENSFYEYYFKSNHWYNSIRKVANTGARFDRISITDSTFMEIPVLHPEPKEQIKVSACLSSLDKLIDVQIQKLETLKIHKKGLMQNLFPQEGEKVPKLRFPEFLNEGKWVEKKLEEIGAFKNGINFPPEKRGSGILTIDVLNMYGEGVDIKYDSLYRVDVEPSDYLLKQDDILFVRSSMKREGIGWTSLFNSFNESVIFCGFLIRFRIYHFQSIFPKFIVYYLRSEIGRRKIISLSGAAAITNISQDSLKSILISFPKLNEQQKIASCFSSLDDLIKEQSDKIEQLKEHRKGLMQSLFPNNNF